jgi:hypothetical protein
VGAGFEFRMSLWIAIALAGLMLFVLLFGVTNAWLRPERFSARRMWRIAFLMAVASYAGALASVIGVHSSGLRIEGGSWLAKLLDVFWRATTLQLGIGLGIQLGALWAVGCRAATVKLQREDGATAPGAGNATPAGAASPPGKPRLASAAAPDPAALPVQHARRPC